MPLRVLAPRIEPSPVAVARLALDAEAIALQLRRAPDAVPRGPAMLRDLPLAFDGLLTSLAAVAAEEWLTESDALRLGRSTAIGVHLACQRAFGERHGAGLPSDPEIVDRILLDAERDHRLALLETRGAARRGDVDALQRILEETVAAGHGSVAALCRIVGAGAAAERARSASGLRASRLARRSAMLAASTIWLGWRILGDSLRAGTSRIAENRPVLARSDPRLRTGTRRLLGLAEEERVAAVGRVVEVGWIERPDIPYSRATLADTDFEIRLHRKNLARLGVAPGAWLWARGKVETAEIGPVLVVEFEGPGQHAGEVWEDWLADAVRAAYDLHPEVVFAEWELPPPDAPGAESDLRCRIEGLIAQVEA